VQEQSPAQTTEAVLIAEDPCTPPFAFAFVGTIMPTQVLNPGATAFRRINPQGARNGRMVFGGLVLRRPSRAGRGSMRPRAR